jgi:putative flippase GtrA
MLIDKWDSLKKNRFYTFVFFGVLNTATTYLIYLLFLMVVNYQVAYMIAYFLGIILAYIVNLRFVFKTQSSVKKAISYPFLYIIQYIIGMLMLFTLVNVLNVPEVWAPLFVITLLIPVSYFLNKSFLLTRQEHYG